MKVLIPDKIDQCLKTSGFYKQNFEGCIYSLVEKMEGKYFIGS